MEGEDLLQVVLLQPRGEVGEVGGGGLGASVVSSREVDIYRSKHASD